MSTAMLSSPSPPPIAVVDAPPATNSFDSFQPSVYIRLRYALFLLGGFCTCILSTNGIWGAARSIPFLNHACSNIVNNVHPSSLLRTPLENICLGHTIVYRITFSMFVFFAIHYFLASSACCCLSAKTRIMLQEHFFWVKSGLLSLLTFCTLFLDHQVFLIWSRIAMGGAICYLLLQIIVLIDFAYSWNDSWASKDDKHWAIALIATTGILYTFGAILNGLGFKWFILSQECSLPLAVVLLTYGAGIFSSIVSIRVSHGSLLPSALIFAHCTVQGFSALSSSSNEACNQLYPSDTESFSYSRILFVCINSVVMGVVLVYTAISTGGSRSAFSLNDPAEMEISSLVKEEDMTPSQKGYCFLHLVLMLASAYMAMLLTSWSRGPEEGTSASVGMWIKLTIDALTMVAYFWSLLGPYILTNRQF